MRCVCVGVLLAPGTQLGIGRLAADFGCMCVYAFICIVCASITVVVMRGWHLSSCFTVGDADQALTITDRIHATWYVLDGVFAWGTGECVDGTCADL